MARQTDHIRRDAEHAARCEVAIQITKFTRRILEAAYAEIGQQLASADGAIDGTQIGREAAKVGLAAYLVGGDVHEPFEAERGQAQALLP